MNPSSRRYGTVTVWLCAALLPPAVLRTAIGADSVIPLPNEDRERIEAGLGPGVIGKAVAAPTIKDPVVFFSMQTARSWRFRYTVGERKDKVEHYILSPRQRAGDVTTWKAITGPTTAMYFRTMKDGSVDLVSDEDRDEGLVTRYSPPVPFWVSNLEPGAVRRSQHSVKVYDLSDPREVSHRGSLNLVYTYVGAYEVIVPAGKFEAVLLKWEHKGKIGPAAIDDVQYILLAKGVGPVALLEKLDASAFLVHQRFEKNGRVLISYGTP